MKINPYSNLLEELTPEEAIELASLVRCIFVSNGKIDQPYHPLIQQWIETVSESSLDRFPFIATFSLFWWQKEKTEWLFFEVEGSGLRDSSGLELEEYDAFAIARSPNAQF